LAQAAREVVESLSLEVFKSHGDVAQRDVVISWWGWLGALSRKHHVNLF